MMINPSYSIQEGSLPSCEAARFGWGCDCCYGIKTILVNHNIIHFFIVDHSGSYEQQLFTDPKCKTDFSILNRINHPQGGYKYF